MNFSKQDTQILKGIALILLLIHHLFVENTELYDDFAFGKYHLFQSIGVVSKVCVSLFVFLSGYGLTIKYKDAVHLCYRSFYWSRLVKLLTNYWLIWILFMPISVLWLGPSLSEAYGNYMEIKLPMDFLGIINLIGWYGYNQTWWFYSCIIGLYFFYPFIRKSMNNHVPLIILISIGLFYLPGPLLISVRLYFLSFVLGMYFAKQIMPPPRAENQWC